MGHSQQCTALHRCVLKHTKSTRTHVLDALLSTGWMCCEIEHFRMVEFLLESRRVLMVPGFFIKIYMYFFILLGFFFFLRQVVSDYIGITHHDKVLFKVSKCCSVG